MKKFRYFMLPAAVLCALGLASCNDGDKYFGSELQDVPMSINQVYLEDYKSSVPDRPVDFARLGQLIRLEGSGFFGVKKVYVNGYDTYFNRAYVTDKSMMFTINTKTPVTDCEDPAVRNTIRLVKDQTELIYEFDIRNGYSLIKSIKNTLPQPGETVKLIGDYLQEPTRIILPGGVEVNGSSAEYDPDGEWCTFTMPSGVTEGGAIIFESPNGVTQSPAYFNERRGLLLNFDDFNKQGCWGWEEGGSMISNKPEDGDLVDDPAGTGRGYCAQLVPDRLLNEGVKMGKTRVTECQTIGDGDKDWENWSRLTDLIPAETPVTEVAFQFDILCPEPWTSGGMIQFQLINNYNFAGFGSDDEKNKGLVYIWAPWLETGFGGSLVPFQATEWTTVTIPFSQFLKYADLIADAESATPTFQMVIDDRNAAKYPNFAIGFSNADFTYKNAAGEDVEFKSSVLNGPKVYTDNWRIVPYKAFAPSDYEEPEDEE